MYKIETIRVTKWFASIPAWIVSTANGVCITIFEIKSIMKAQICHDSILFVSNFCKHWELYWLVILTCTCPIWNDPCTNIIFHKNRYLSTCNISFGAQT